MNTTPLLNSISATDMMESQQHAAAPKGLQSLPRELRDKIYQLVLLSESHCKTHCCVDYLHGGQLASTHKAVEPQSLRMDVNSVAGQALFEPQRTFEPAKATSILLVCRQILNEASQVLYENTQLQCKPQHYYWPTQAPKNEPYFQYCAPYALLHIRAISLAFDTNLLYGEFDEYKLRVDLQKLPNLRLLKLHFDCAERAPVASRFDWLCLVADHAEYVIDFHTSHIFVDDGTGWGEPVQDALWFSNTNQGLYAAAWAAAKEKAFEMRAAFVKDLGAIFQQRGKKLKIQGD